MIKKRERKCYFYPQLAIYTIISSLPEEMEIKWKRIKNYECLLSYRISKEKTHVCP